MDLLQQIELIGVISLVTLIIIIFSFLVYKNFIQVLIKRFKNKKDIIKAVDIIKQFKDKDTESMQKELIKNGIIDPVIIKLAENKIVKEGVKDGKKIEIQQDTDGRSTGNGRERELGSRTTNEDRGRETSADLGKTDTGLQGQRALQGNEDQLRVKKSRYFN